MPLSLSINPSFLIDPKHRVSNRHALPWAVPQSGRVFKGQRMQILWFYMDILFDLDWHIACKL